MSKVGQSMQGQIQELKREIQEIFGEHLKLFKEFGTKRSGRALPYGSVPVGIRGAADHPCLHVEKDTVVRPGPVIVILNQCI